jgi:hypothetical protein
MEMNTVGAATLMKGSEMSDEERMRFLAGADDLNAGPVIEGIACVQGDIYEFVNEAAMDRVGGNLAEFDVQPDDWLEGFRRMIDAAIRASKE